MPYSTRRGGFERSRSTGHVPIVENVMVQERLRNYRVFVPEADAGPAPDLMVDADVLGAPGEPVRWVIAVDGSPHEEAVREEFPSTRVGYIQIAGALINLDEMLGQATQRFVDPSAIREATQDALYSMVLPGSNVCRSDMPTVKDSWRAEVFEIFRDYTIEGVSLLDVFMLLVRASGDKSSPSGGVTLARCSANEACTARAIDVPATGTTCPDCGGMLLPTDALRVHEEVSEEHGNATALGRLMTCLEHITTVAYLHFLEQRQPRVLSRVGFIVDGPLALFGPQAWLHTAILAFLLALRQRLAAQHLGFPVIVGVEKTGQFAEHAATIAKYIPLRNLMMLPDEYIYEHILTFRPSVQSAFGRDTYYGQKFYYRTARGQLLTVTVPKTVDGEPDPYDIKHYPFLADTVALLDRIGTSLYEDALIPIALAHSYASIPLRTGSKVLRILSRDLLGLTGS